MENEIKLVQNPIIKHELLKIGKSVTARLSELNLESQVATNDTIQTLKKLRAELNKEHATYKGQFKTVKDEVLKPVKEIEPVYKSEISEKYENADYILKDKIGAFEITIKNEKESNLKVYFIELCQSENIDFVTFDKLNIEVNLSITEKKYKEQINEFMQKICSDVDLIKMEEFEAEIMAEFKQTLNASESIINVKSRKKREQEEKDRIKAQENLSRKNKLESLGMPFDEMTKSFVYSDDIYISENVANELDKSEFMTKFIEIEEKIKAIKNKRSEELSPYITYIRDYDKMISLPEPEYKKEFEDIRQGALDHLRHEGKKANEQPKEEIKKPVQQEIKPEIKEPLQKPVKEKKLELVEAEFRVYGTMPQLKALGQYMKDNNLKYENI